MPQIPNQMMRRYTRPGDWVIDPFAGSGTTLIEARRLGRNCLGLELQPNVAARARALIDSEPNRHGCCRDRHCRLPGGRLPGAAAPVWPRVCPAGDRASALLRHHRSATTRAILEYRVDRRVSGHVLGTLIDRVAPVLDAGRYLALVIGDKYAGGEWIPLGFQAMNEVLKRDFTLKSIVVKNFEQTAGKRNQQELWKYRALVGGFYVFKHEYIFVFRKR
ncbi:MAG: DNA methyltransferase [Kouleothrix sp.]